MKAIAETERHLKGYLGGWQKTYPSEGKWGYKQITRSKRWSRRRWGGEIGKKGLCRAEPKVNQKTDAQG